ncbi:hypothetical protein F4818DRAFT_423223 [Hypoxylon cercidicola]|nr:hypothetical protein F4818DRAFT_423223 [Hypoxylon cercidicola]
MAPQKLNGQSQSKGQQAQKEGNLDDSSDGEFRITPLSLTAFFRRNSTKAQLPRQRATSNAPQPPRRSNTIQVSESSPSRGHGPGYSSNRNAIYVGKPQNNAADISQHEPEPSGACTLKRQHAITRPVQGYGTRGIFVPVYACSPVEFSQSERLRNPGVYLPLLSPQPEGRDSGPVAVRLYHCESLYLSQDPLKSPAVGVLISAACAFLGECELRGWAALGQHNQGYVGLNAAQKSGGYHLHYPDDAGVVIFEEDIGDDWEQVMKVHRRYAPRGVPLLVGVGPGQAGKCCVRGRG